MKKHNFNSYEKALNYYVINEKPELLSKLGKKTNKKGSERGKQKSQKFITQRRGKPNNQQKSNYSQYVKKDGTLDTEKLNRLPTKEGLKIVTAIEASNS